MAEDIFTFDTAIRTIDLVYADYDIRTVDYPSGSNPSKRRKIVSSKGKCG